MIFPDDLRETVVLILTDNLKNMSELNKFKNTDKNDLFHYHFGLGAGLRNHYKLWENENLEKYLNDDESFVLFSHADDLSFEFIKEAQKLLKNN